MGDLANLAFILFAFLFRKAYYYLIGDAFPKKGNNMSDYKSKLLARKVMLLAHPNYQIQDISKTESPDIWAKNCFSGIEVTRALSDLEGKFNSYRNGKIRDKDKIFSDHILSNGSIYIEENTKDVLQRINVFIGKKTRLVSKYRAKNPWLKHLSLAIVIDYCLEPSDLWIVISKLTPKEKLSFEEFYFIMPDSLFLYSRYELIRLT